MKRFHGLAMGLALIATPLVSLWTGAATAAPTAHRHVRRAPAPPPPQLKLHAVMNSSMLAREVPNFETVSGPALKVWPNGDRDYKLDGCDLTALTTGTTVTALKLTLSKTCTVDLNDFFMFEFDFPTANKLTLGAFSAKLHNRKITADCLTACPAGAPTVIHEHFVGSTLLARLEVKLDVAIDDDARRAALARWTKAMGDAPGGPDYLTAARYQCDSQFDPAAIEAFDKITPSAVTIGYNLSTPEC